MECTIGCNVDIGSGDRTFSINFEPQPVALLSGNVVKTRVSISYAGNISCYMPLEEALEIELVKWTLVLGFEDYFKDVPQVRVMPDFAGRGRICVFCSNVNHKCMKCIFYKKYKYFCTEHKLYHRVYHMYGAYCNNSSYEERVGIVEEVIKEIKETIDEIKNCE